MQKLKRIIYYFYNLTELFEKLYIRYYLRVSNPDKLILCLTNEYKTLEKYEAIKKILHPKLENDLYLEIMECLDIIQLNQPNHLILEKYNIVLQKLDKLPQKTFTSERWRTVATVFYSNGLYRAGAICRRKSQERLSSMRGCYVKKALAYLEKSDLRNAKICIDRICKNPFLLYSLDNKIQLYKFYYNLLCKSEIDKYSIDWTKVGNRNAAFTSLIENRKVKIVGPAVNLNSKKKDKEFWIRTSSTEEEVKEHKADAIYYSLGTAESIFGQLEIENKGHAKICIYDYEGRKKEIRGMFFSNAIDEILYMGTMNAVPHIVMDVLINGGIVIYIEGTTLYMSEKLYHSNYFFHEEEDRRIYSYSLSRHNLQSQFMFLKNLYCMGYIKADDVLEHILDLSVEKYLENMEQIYPFDRILRRNNK